MKTYVLSMVINLLVVATLSGKIKNGYEPEINTAHEGLRKLSALILGDSNLLLPEKNRMRELLYRHQDFILYHELTERLLLQFSMISPDIYNQIDSIKDAQERPIDVYVKFLPMEKMNGSIAGGTNVPMGDDGDVYSSSYGLHTVSVKIVLGNDALSLLAHEFGHIKYQVPNISTYRKFYVKHYQVITSDSGAIGHHHMDPSGQEAFEFQRRFRLQYDLKSKNLKFDRPIALLKEVNKDIQGNLLNTDFSVGTAR
jgi:hypothetical protein